MVASAERFGLTRRGGRPGTWRRRSCQARRAAEGPPTTVRGRGRSGEVGAGKPAGRLALPSRGRGGTSSRLRLGRGAGLPALPRYRVARGRGRLVPPRARVSVRRGEGRDSVVGSARVHARVCACVRVPACPYVCARVRVGNVRGWRCRPVFAGAAGQFWLPTPKLRAHFHDGLEWGWQKLSG